MGGGETHSLGSLGVFGAKQLILETDMQVLARLKQKGGIPASGS